MKMKMEEKGISIEKLNSMIPAVMSVRDIVVNSVLFDDKFYSRKEACLS